MKVLKQIFDFYINSSIHVALSVFLLSWITLLEFNLPYDESVLYFIFYASIKGYNFVKYFGIAKFHHRSLANWLKIIQLFSLLCFILLCYYALQLEVKTLIYISVFGFVTFLYAIPFLPKHLFMDEKQNLRSIGGLKVYVIALVWAGVTVLLPIINANYAYDLEVVITFFQRFLLVVALMLPFEIRDLNYDSLKLSTIPQLIGVKRTKLLGLLLLVSFCLLEFFKDTFNATHFVSLCMVSLVTLVLIYYSKQDQGRYYSGFWVEGVPILWLLLILLM
ncbi:hypothetical protein OE09_2412 [Flavobacteriaceae bacterium MAR_2010_72]|nr:hypothetical protein OE09_2412 [Flavobacteriaceae bacterium MAR_2010_72]TVZ58880.1 hypothetical protein NA63_1395 [Flavobacteriaceae bacterium MAR_2010_105]